MLSLIHSSVGLVALSVEGALVVNNFFPFVLAEKHCAEDSFFPFSLVLGAVTFFFVCECLETTWLGILARRP